MGTRLVRGKLVVQKDKVSEDMLVPGDQRTATLVQNVANKVCKFIQMEVDYPSKYEDNFFPILDLKVAVQNQKVLQLPDHCRQVCHAQPGEESLSGAGGGEDLQEHQQTPAGRHEE